MKEKKRKKIKLSPVTKITGFILLFLCVLLLIVSFSKKVDAAENGMKVTFLDVGQGLCVLVESGDDVMVYDGGDRSHSSYVVSYLKNHGVDTINYLIASHWDEDHIAGLVGCLNAFTVENVIGSGYTHDSKIYQSFMDSAAMQRLEIQYPKPGEQITIGNTCMTILSQANYGDDDSNNNSVAVRLDCDGASVILTGDAEAKEEADMLASGLNLDCDVLCLGHHGSATATSWDFLEASTPEYAVISCGKENSYGHPHEETMEKMESMGIEIFRTDDQGEISFTAYEGDISWSTEPSDDYSSGEGAAENVYGSGDSGVSDRQEQVPEGQVTAETGAFILNTNSKKIHKPSCKSVRQMSEKNKLATDKNLEELQAEGYETCQNCF